MTVLRCQDDDCLHSCVMGESSASKRPFPGYNWHSQTECLWGLGGGVPHLEHSADHSPTPTLPHKQPTAADNAVSYAVVCQLPYVSSQLQTTCAHKRQRTQRPE